jgi:histone H3/H4
LEALGYLSGGLRAAIIFPTNKGTCFISMSTAAQDIPSRPDANNSSSGKKSSALKKRSSAKKSLPADKTDAKAKKSIDKRGGSNRIGMTNQAIRRLTQRGGMSRVHPAIFRDSEKFCEELLRRVLCDAVALTYHDKLKTVSAEHVLKSMTLSDIKLLGYADRHSIPSSKDEKSKSSKQNKSA